MFVLNDSRLEKHIGNVDIHGRRHAFADGSGGDIWINVLIE